MYSKKTKEPAMKKINIAANKVRTNDETKVMVIQWLTSRPGEPEAWVRVAVRNGVESCVGATVD